ncbi:hypothetical protein ABIE41_000182 [Bosea sp. OAE506]|uniref:hypothetical protein n=1 Tax=Bosea sp. OAE506 TaxID=2663870 RepID=UPI0019EAA580
MKEHNHTTKTPPVPPANRSFKGTGGGSRTDVTAAGDRKTQPSDRTGRQADIKQNITHQGYQQDR